MAGAAKFDSGFFGRAGARRRCRPSAAISVATLLLGAFLVAGCDPLVTIEGRLVDVAGARLETCRAWRIEEGYEYEDEIISVPGSLNDSMLPPSAGERFHYRVDCGLAYRVHETREITGTEIYDSNYEIDLGEIVITGAE